LGTPVLPEVYWTRTSRPVDQGSGVASRCGPAAAMRRRVCSPVTHGTAADGTTSPVADGTAADGATGGRARTIRSRSRCRAAGPSRWAMPAAQSSGQKAQEDAQLGQGSIFDIGDAPGAEGQDASSVQRPPISATEFERRELLAAEKETLGTYLSSHPLTDVRDALRARVDCSLAEIGSKPDGSWVTVGGIVTERKKIRTKKGADMMFATLDDVEGQVELLIFNSAFAANEEKIEADAVLLVRGRVDHKERGETKLVVQEAELFEPGEEELARATKIAAKSTEPLVLKVSAADCAPALLEELKAVFEHFPGETEVLLEMQTREGPRTLRFGDGFKIRDSTALRAELDGVLGPTGAMAA